MTIDTCSDAGSFGRPSSKGSSKTRAVSVTAGSGVCGESSGATGASGDVGGSLVTTGILPRRACA